MWEKVFTYGTHICARSTLKVGYFKFWYSFGVYPVNFLK